MLFYKDKCTSCGKCEKICPNHLKQCTLCEKCTIYCPNDAREVCGKEFTPDKLFSEIIKDKHYFDSSNGGVTFSGGECTLQLDFLIEILRKCKGNGINTAVDTSGNIPYEHLEKILPYTDTLLYDVKCITEELHKKYIGVSNGQILSNLKKLSNHFNGKKVIRIPLIGGFNDTDEEILKIAEFLKPLNITKTELLPYHKMGLHKYTALNMEITEFYTPQKERIERFKKILKICT